MRVRWVEELALQAVKQLSTVFLWGFPNWKEDLFVGDVEQQEKNPSRHFIGPLEREYKGGEGEEKKIVLAQRKLKREKHAKHTRHSNFVQLEVMEKIKLIWRACAALLHGEVPSGTKYTTEGLFKKTSYTWYAWNWNSVAPRGHSQTVISRLVPFSTPSHPPPHTVFLDRVASVCHAYMLIHLVFLFAVRSFPCKASDIELSKKSG